MIKLSRIFEAVSESRAVRPAPGKQPSRTSLISTAYKLGQKAFADGRKMIPAHDPNLQHFVFKELKSKSESGVISAKEYTALAKAWSDGFTRANLDAPMKEARNYKKEYESYHSKPEQKKRRAQRNKSRRHMEREGKVRKGDTRDVHHRDNNPHNQKSSNVTVMARSKNRSIK